MNFWTISLCVLTFTAVGLLVGWGWFSICGWDELLNCRNYKRLAVLIPFSFVLAFLVVGAPVRTEIKPEVVPQPTAEKKVTAKRNVKKLKTKPKKEEEASQDNSQSDEETPQGFEDNGDNQ